MESERDAPPADAAAALATAVHCRRIDMNCMKIRLSFTFRLRFRCFPPDFHSSNVLHQPLSHTSRASLQLLGIRDALLCCSTPLPIGDDHLLPSKSSPSRTPPNPYCILHFWSIEAWLFRSPRCFFSQVKSVKSCRDHSPYCWKCKTH